MEKISIQALNALFDYLNNQSNTIFWVRDKSFNNQIYLSQSFENNFKLPTETMYKNPMLLYDLLVNEDYDLTKKLMDSRGDKFTKLSNGDIYFRFINNDNKLIYVKDTGYMLMDDEQKHVGFAGFGQVIPEQQWQQEVTLQKFDDQQNPKKLLRKHVFDVLQRELNLTARNIDSSEQDGKQQNKANISFNGHVVSLTRREIETLEHLMLGLSAKQTASKMFVSTRTVEFHLNNIKEKVGCRTKIELLSKIVIDKEDES